MGTVKRINGKKAAVVRAAAAIMACMLAAVPSPAYAKTAASEDVEKMIMALPAKEKVEKKDAGKIRSIMESYMALSLAEQTDISQELYEKLKEEYDDCVYSGYITDIQKEAEAAKEEEERTAREQAALTPSGETEKGVTYYTFAITPDAPAKSVTMRFIVDIDGDGVPDPPLTVNVTTPSGEKFSVSPSDIEMKTEGHHILYTWTDKFLQFDVAKAENGNWSIETSEPCVFSVMDYAGLRLDITPEKEKGDAMEFTPESNGGDGLAIALMGILAVIIGAAAVAVRFLGIELPSIPMPKGRKRGRTAEDEEEDEEDEDAPYEEESEEEINKSIMADVLRRKQEAAEMDLSAEDSLEEEEGDGDDDGFRVYKEGETGLLDGNSPFQNGGGLIDSEETEPYVPDGSEGTGNTEEVDDDGFFDDGLFD